MNNASQQEALKEQAMSQFRPSIPIRFHKEYTIFICVGMVLMLLINKLYDIGFWFRLMELGILYAYTVYMIRYLDKKCFKLTLTACLCADALAFISAIFVIVIMGNYGVITTVIISAYWVVKFAIAQTIAQLSYRSYERTLLKRMKQIEKQRQQYEKKVDNIYKNTK